MPSLNKLFTHRPTRHYGGWLLLFVSLCCLWFGSATAQQSSTPSETEVSEAVAQLKQDPNLAPERKIKSLKWVKQQDASEKESNNRSRWLVLLEWIANLFQWLADTSRLLLWIVVGVIAALLVLFLLRVFKRTAERQPFVAPVLQPTHVREWDIRPESLPDDIGAGAWQLWNRGEQRAALALLYRGCLSRLVHVHAVSIRASSTEAECLALASAKLPTVSGEYVAQLLSVWQRAVYGDIEPTALQVQTLCENFAAALTPASRSWTADTSAGVPA